MNFDVAFDRVIGNDDRTSHIDRLLRRAIYEESGRHAVAVYTPDNSRAYDCAIKNCNNKAYAKGLCNAHYVRQRNGVDMSFPVRNRKRGVGCIDCGAACNSKGGSMRCAAHYRRRRALILKTTAVSALGGKCARCAGTFPQAVFDFHHLRDKHFTIGAEILNKSIKVLAEELAKCELLCANCHRIEHNREF